MKPLTADLYRTAALYRTDVLRHAPSAVDTENNTLRGVQVIRLGDLNEGDARPWFADELTLAQVVEFGNAPNKGIKSRFTHPNMSEDGLGKHLGKIRGFVIAGDAVHADLHLSDAAFDTPFGDLGTHVLTMAAEFPEDFGMSIVPVLDHAAMEAEQTEDGRQPMRLKGLKAVDVVDSPAASDSMFDVNSPQGIPAAATWFFDTHFSDLEPEAVLQRVVGFMRRYYGRGDISAEGLDMTSATAAAPEAPAVDFSVEGKRYITMFGDIGAVWFLEGKAVEDCFAIKCEQFETAIAAKDEVIDGLRTQLEAALAAGGEPDPLSAEPVEPASEADTAIAARASELEGLGYAPGQAKFAAGREAKLKK